MKRSETLLNLLLIPLDYAMVLSSFLVSYLLRNYINSVFILPFSEFIKLAAAFSAFWILVFASLGLYDFHLIRRRSLDEFFKIFAGSTAAITLLGAVIFLTHLLDFSRFVLMFTFFASVGLVYLGRYALGFMQGFFYRHGIGVHRIIIVGVENAHVILSGLQAENYWGKRVLGLVYLEGEKSKKIQGLRQLGGFQEIDHFLDKYKPDEVIISTTKLPAEKTDHLLRLCNKDRIAFKFLPDIFSTPPARLVPTSLAGIPLVEMRLTSLEGTYAFLKRFIDVTFSVLALIMVCPILLVTAIAIKLDSPGPALFPHRRVGASGREFDLYKFRSMKMYRVNNKLVHAEEYLKVNKQLAQQLHESPFYKIKDDPRVCRVGRIIRKLSIDELPQFWNVLRGEMSVVGPRAYIKQELDKQRRSYPQTKDSIERLMTVKPGITGLWQVSGRSNIEFSERVAMDAYYATHASVGMDLRIILQTIPVVIRGSGAM